MIAELFSALTSELLAQYGMFMSIGFAAALVSTLIGFGGGIVILVLLSPVIPAKELVGVVMLVQLTNVIFRFRIQRREVNYGVTGRFLLGAVPGVALAMVLFERINADMVAMVMGIFLLFSAWRPSGIPMAGSSRTLPLAGGITSFLTLLVGAAGPAIAAVLGRLQLAKAEYMATLTACLLGSGLLVLLAFYNTGFPLLQWWLPCLLMILAGIPGALLGNHWMHSINERWLFWGVRLAMVAAGINLLL